MTTSALATTADAVRSAPHRTADRREVKLPLPAELASDVEAWVRLHPAMWRTTYPARQVNNIYFDTPTYLSLNANLSGTSCRSKLRLRWYGRELDHLRVARLELKQKVGWVGWKASLPVAVDVHLAGTRWSTVARLLQRAAGPLGCLWLTEAPTPVLVNAYWRDYYATADGTLRLTVDRDLRSYDQRSSLAPNLSRPLRGEAKVVIELKAANDARALKRLEAALSWLPPSIERFSKYVTGVLSMPDFA